MKAAVKPSLSIAMCTYNGSAFIKEQLGSFINQTRLPDELVICDDCSDDETVPIIEEFSEHASFPVRLHVNDQNLGSNENFAKAISLCAGDIIFLADQDDVWLPGKLEKIERYFLEHPGVDGVFTDAEMVDKNLQPLGYTFWQSKHFTSKRQRQFKKGDAAGVLAQCNTVAGAAFAFRSAFKDEVLPIPPAWTHDSWIAFYLGTMANLEFIDECLNIYRQHSEQQVGSEKKDFRSRLTEARDDDSSAALELARGKYVQAKQRFSGGPAMRDPRGVERLKEKMLHFEARRHLSHKVWKRLPVIIRELLSRRYHRYSSGIQSAVKDLLIR